MSAPLSMDLSRVFSDNAVKVIGKRGQFRAGNEMVCYGLKYVSGGLISGLENRQPIIIKCYRKFRTQPLLIQIPTAHYSAHKPD